MRALLDAGVGVEAGVWSADDAERLARTGLAPQLARVLIEVMTAGIPEAIARTFRAVRVRRSY